MLWQISVANEGEARHFLNNLDQAKRRTPRDNLGVLLFCDNSLEGISLPLAGTLAEGIALWKCNDLSAKTSDHKNIKIRAILLRQDLTLTNRVAVAFQKLAYTPGGKFIDRSPVIAAMFATYDRAPEDAELFWADVRSGENGHRGKRVRLIYVQYLLGPISQSTKYTVVKVETLE